MNPQNIPNENSDFNLGDSPITPTAEQLNQRAAEAAKNIITSTTASVQPNNPPTQPDASPPGAVPQSPQIITPFTQPPVEQTQSTMPYPSPNAPQASAVLSAQPAPTAPTTTTPEVTRFSATPPSSGEVPQVIMGGVDNPIVPPSSAGQKPINSNGKKKKILFVSGLSILVFAGLVSACMFLWYIPNAPNNVWSIGLSRTGKQFDVLLEKLQDEESVKKLEKSVFNVKGTLSLDSQNYSVDVDSKYDPKNSASIVKVSGTGGQAENNFAIDSEVRTQLITNAVFPNIYFKLSGFGSLGADALFPGVTQYDNKWIAIEQDFLKKLSESAALVNGQENITQKDVVSIIADVNNVSKEYIFTDNTSKAVIQQTKFIGTEESEGIKANHYKAKINVAHARTYCAAIIDKLSQNSAVKKIVNLSEQEYTAEVQKQKDECGKVTIDETEFDIWVDKKMKVLHKVRQYEDLEKAKKEVEAEKATCIADTSRYNDLMGEGGASFCTHYDERIEIGERYTEFGQVFKSKDSVMLFVGTKSATNKDTSNVRGEVTLNIKDLTADGSVKANSEGNNKYKLDLTLATKPFDGTIDASKPEGAIPLQQVLDSLGLNNQ